MNPPSKILLMLEVIRSMFEYMQSVALAVPLQYMSPKGDGHPVIIFPGLGAADGSTYFVRNFLSNLGYTVYPWGLGRNRGPREGLAKLTDALVTNIRTISNMHGGAKVSLIGWSLGGIYAREIAKLIPDLVRQVITLGTPFKGTPNSTNATLFYEMLSKDKSHYDPAIVASVALKPSVPFTSIFSKTDGVVSWESSIEEVTDISENIEIPGASHLGLGHNPISMYIISNRLSQPEGMWHPYNKS